MTEDDWKDPALALRADLLRCLNMVNNYGITGRNALRWFIALNWANDLQEMEIKEAAEEMLDCRPIRGFSDEKLVAEAVPLYDPRNDYPRKEYEINFADLEFTVFRFITHFKE